MEIECLENRLPDYHLVPENERFFDRGASINVDLEWFRHAYGILPAVGVFSDPLACDREAKLLNYVHGQHRSHRAGVNKRIGLVGAHLLWADLPAAH